VNRSFDFHPEAREELRRAVQFYEQESPGLGREFAAEARVVIDHILDHPLSGARAEADTRRKLLLRFPYSVIYLIEPTRLRIIALMHQRREPGYWLTRIDEQ
jgi:plasmid stabilization system protein ParE